MAADKYEFIGTVVKVTPIIPVTGKFKEKCTFVVRSDSGDREIAFLTFDSQIEDLVKPLELNDKVKVIFTVKSREYNGTYTTNCFAIDVIKIVQKRAYSTNNANQTGGAGGSSSQAGNGNPFNSQRQRQSTGWSNQNYSQSPPQNPPPPKQPSYTNYFDGCLNGDMAKKRYRELAIQYHPDKPGGDSDKMKEINKQYQTWR